MHVSPQNAREYHGSHSQSRSRKTVKISLEEPRIKGLKYSFLLSTSLFAYMFVIRCKKSVSAARRRLVLHAPQ